MHESPKPTRTRRKSHFFSSLLGMYPASPEVASIWYADMEVTGPDSLLFVVFMRGKPNWHDRQTDFKHEMSREGVALRFTSGDTLVLIDYVRKDNEIQLFGRRFDVTQDNVFLAEPVGDDGKFPIVKGLGHRDLHFSADKNPVLELLDRDENLRGRVLGPAA